MPVDLLINKIIYMCSYVSHFYPLLIRNKLSDYYKLLLRLCYLLSFYLYKTQLHVLFIFWKVTTNLKFHESNLFVLQINNFK